MKLPYAVNGDQLLPRGASDALESGLRYGTAVVREVTRTLVERSGTTCQPGNNSPVCAKPTSSTNNTTLPIVLGAVIPITCALCVFVYLHRRNNKKQAREDANDPHKSMDFGMEFTPGPKKPKRGLVGGRKGGDVPEMTIAHHDPMRPERALRGLSMDMMNNPYLLPAGLHGSRESLHSMSRITTHDEHDPYRPVTFLRGSTDTSRSPRPFNENASMYSASTNHTGDKSSLVANAQRMSQSFPKRGDSVPSMSSPAEESTRELRSTTRSVTPSRKTSLASSTSNLPEINEKSVPPKKDFLPPLPPMPFEQPAEQPPPSRQSSQTTTSSRPPPRKASLAAAALPQINVRASDASYYGEELPPPPPPPKVVEPENDDITDIYAGRFSIDNSAPSQQLNVQQPNPNRMSVMGLRPLPPNLPEEHPEQRANRIRSFYKEYFDDSRPNPEYGFYEDYDPAYLDAAVYDPEVGDYAYPAAPFAQPLGRRAMTPPPRGAAHFSGPDHARHYSTMSGGRAPGGFRGRPPMQAPKKKLPPPKALTSLPTPYMLKEDTALIMNPIDFAPPTSFRETQNGRRPDSPMGIQRPYSPAVKAYSPLVPAFDELSVMPSPHHLRKSGTFTSLDFAALPRFRGQEGTASDAGSIRSARSGISAMQIDAVRAGAYRVSRIPKEYVTSREDMGAQLRPKMNLTTPA